jgi:aryl-alcohol dehydrogenase
VFVGNHPEEATVPLAPGALEFNQSIRGCVLGQSVPRHFIPLLLRLHADGRFPFDRMIRRYPLDEIEAAVADAEQGTTIKPVLVMP